MSKPEIIERIASFLQNYKAEKPINFKEVATEIYEIIYERNFENSNVSDNVDERKLCFECKYADGWKCTHDPVCGSQLEYWEHNGSS